MANAIEKKDITKLQAVTYATLRDDLKTGDLVFCSGRYWISKVIQRLTKSAWSHVGVIYKDVELNRVLILESEILIGVRLIPLSKYLKNYKDNHKPYKGSIAIAKLTKPLNKKEIDAGISFGLDELARPYDTYEIVRILFRILFKITKPTRNKSYICSELVRDIYKKANKKFKQIDNYISPDDVWQDDDVQFVGRIL